MFRITHRNHFILLAFLFLIIAAPCLHADPFNSGVSKGQFGKPDFFFSTRSDLDNNGGFYAIVNDGKAKILYYFDRFNNPTTITVLDQSVKIHCLVIAQKNDLLFIGGSFNSVMGVKRKNAVALRIDSHRVSRWDPSPDKVVKSIADIGDGIIIIGGSFNFVNGQKKRFLAATDKATGDLINMFPEPDGSIENISLSYNSTAIYLNGDFKKIGYKIRDNYACFDLKTGKLTNWNPNSLEWRQSRLSAR